MGIYIASPEKAFLDQIYFVARGKAALDLDELDLKKLSVRTLKNYAERFPAYIRSRAENMIPGSMTR